MNRRGVALLAVLWLLAVLSAGTGAVLAWARLGAATSRNRILLTRADWAREACGEILLARYAARGAVLPVGSVDLGRGSWCRALVEDAAARLDLNRTPPDVLRSLLANDTLADALLDWRDLDDIPRPLGAEADWYRTQSRRLPRNGPLADVEELSLVRGFDRPLVNRLAPLLTVRGSGRVDLNAAPAEVLAALPGMGPEAVATILSRRHARGIASADELLALVPASARDRLLAHYQEFSTMAAFAAPQITVGVEGGVAGSAVVSRGRLTLVPAAGRLAVIRREVE